MAKAQYRRTVSLKWSVYQRVQKMCKEDGVSVSSYIESQITMDMDARERPAEEVREPKPGTPGRRPPSDSAASGIFLF